MLWQYLEPYANVIWDWNGTLLNDHEAAWNAEKKVFTSLGLSHVDSSERKKLFTMPVQEYYRRVNFDFSKMSYADLAHAWFEQYEEEIKSVGLFAGTAATLEKVVSAGKKQFILSAAPQAHLEVQTKKIGIAKFFTAIYGLEGKSADCKRARGRDLFREHALDPRATILVGDMVHDAEVADELGCEVLLIADGHQDVEALRLTGKKVLASRF